VYHCPTIAVLKLNSVLEFIVVWYSAD